MTLQLYRCLDLLQQFNDDDDNDDDDDIMTVL